MIEPYLREEGMTQVVARADELPAVSDFIAELAAKVSHDWPVLLCAKNPSRLKAKYREAGGDTGALKTATNVDVSPEGFDALLEALPDYPRLIVFPNLAEFVPNANSRSHSEQILAYFRKRTVVFGWPSSQRRQAMGCGLWTNAGDVNLTLADIQPAQMISEEQPLTPREKALWFIAGALSFGPRPLKEILPRARARGIKDTTFYAAGREIVNATRTKQTCGESMWELRESRMNTGFFASLSHSEAGNDD
jgi:hypothetical protein